MHDERENPTYEAPRIEARTSIDDPLIGTIVSNTDT